MGVILAKPLADGDRFPLSIRCLAGRFDMARRVNWSAVLPWVLRFLIAIAILAAPIITFWAFTDPETSDPTREQRLRDAKQNHDRVPAGEATPYDSRP
jgi:hypothetical protein